MSQVGKPARATQHRVVELLRDELGHRYLGDWNDRDGNSNIEVALLTKRLQARGDQPMIEHELALGFDVRRAPFREVPATKAPSKKLVKPAAKSVT